MKILHVTDKILPGGAERAMVEQITLLRKTFSHELLVLAISDAVEYKWYFDQNQIRVDVLELVGKKRDFLTVYGRLRTFHEYILKTKPDIVQCHFAKSEILCFLYKRFFNPECRLINTYHGLDPWKEKGDLYFKVRNYCSGHIYRSFDKGIFVSRHLKDWHVHRYGLSPASCHVVFNGIATKNPFELVNNRILSEFNIRTNEFVVTTVSRVDPFKGIDVLLEAVMLIGAEIENLRVFVVGQKLDGEFQSQLYRNAPRQVVFTGFRSDVEYFLSRADVFVLPSFMEGMPNAVLEAMNFGVPVVATNVGGIPDIIRDEQDGLLIKPRNAKQLSEQILRLYRDQELRSRISQNGSKRVQKDFTLASTVTQLDTLYNLLMASS